MAKSKEVFICQNCGASSPKWQGQCAGCGEWNTLLAELQSATTRKAPVSIRVPRMDASSSLAAEAILEQSRLTTGSTELDRVLGGGLVPGSVTLIGGDPGIGKSTLMLQAAAALNAIGPVLYATGEESLKQVALGGRRLGDAPPNWVASARHPEQRYCWSGMSPRKDKSPDPACSSTWSTQCSISRAIPAAATGCCARSRIASAPPTKSAYSPWWSRVCARSRIRPRYFCRATPSRCPAVLSP